MLTYAVFRQLGDVVKHEFVRVAQNVLRSFVGVWEDLTHNLDALLEVVELGVTTELVSDL
jgi:hypothetical protein